MTRKAKNVAGNENKVILCNKCLGNYMKLHESCLKTVIGPKVVDHEYLNLM